jgi:hypothetical protein
VVIYLRVQAREVVMTGVKLFLKGEKITQQNWYPLPALDYVVLFRNEVIAHKDGKSFEFDEGELEIIWNMLVEDVWDIYYEETSNVDPKTVVA